MCYSKRYLASENRENKDLCAASIAGLDEKENKQANRTVFISDFHLTGVAVAHYHANCDYALKPVTYHSCLC